MTRAAAQTGSGPTGTIAIEQYFPPGERLVDDPLAYPILPLGMRIFVQLMRPRFMRDWLIRVSEKYSPGVYGGMMCRKRYFDDKLIQSLGHIDAVVNLGAGFDTRVYRLPGVESVPVWEVDQQANIEAKRARLESIFGEVPAHVRLVAIDFDRDDLGTTLAAHGYRADMRTFFIWEGVTPYLTQEGVDATFAFLSKAAPGSRLVFDYMRKEFIDGTELYGQETLYKSYVVKRHLWPFGLDHDAVPGYLARYGWRVLEHPTIEELDERYVRPSGRALLTTPIEPFVFAEKLAAEDSTDVVAAPSAETPREPRP